MVGLVLCSKVKAGTSVSGNLVSTEETAWRKAAIAVSPAQVDKLEEQGLRRVVVQDERALGQGVLQALRDRGVEVVLSEGATFAAMMPRILDG